MVNSEEIGVRRLGGNFLFMNNHRARGWIISPRHIHRLINLLFSPSCASRSFGRNPPRSELSPHEAHATERRFGPDASLSRSSPAWTCSYRHERLGCLPWSNCADGSSWWGYWRWLAVRKSPSVVPRWSSTATPSTSPSSATHLDEVFWFRLCKWSKKQTLLNHEKIIQAEREKKFVFALSLMKRGLNCIFLL